MLVITDGIGWLPVLGQIVLKYHTELDVIYFFNNKYTFGNTQTVMPVEESSFFICFSTLIFKLFCDSPWAPDGYPASHFCDYNVDFLNFILYYIVLFIEQRLIDSIYCYLFGIKDFWHRIILLSTLYIVQTLTNYRFSSDIEKFYKLVYLTFSLCF